MQMLMWGFLDFVYQCFTSTLTVLSPILTIATEPDKPDAFSDAVLVVGNDRVEYDAIQAIEYYLCACFRTLHGDGVALCLYQDRNCLHICYGIFVRK